MCVCGCVVFVHHTCFFLIYYPGVVSVCVCGVCVLFLCIIHLLFFLIYHVVSLCVYV